MATAASRKAAETAEQKLADWEAGQIDLDQDQVPDGLDNCPTISNPPVVPGTFRQADSDLDGLGDACDPTQTFDDVIKTAPLQTQFGQGSGGNAGACATPDCSATSLSWGPLLSGTPVFDHGKEIYHTGLTSDNALSVSGGSARTSPSPKFEPVKTTLLCPASSINFT